MADLFGAYLQNFEKNNYLKFPPIIGFEATTSYTQAISELKNKKKLVFDLSNTHAVHSSFIGFLLDLKRNLSKNGGDLELILSVELKKLFNTLEIYDFFNCHKQLNALKNCS